MLLRVEIPPHRAGWDSREMLPAVSCRPDDAQHLVDRGLEVVVHHDVVGELQADRLLVVRLAQPGDDALGIIAAQRSRRSCS